MRTYKLSSLSPERWEVTDDSDNGPAAVPSGSKSDEPDALGLRRGGTLAFALSLLLSALADQLRVPHSMLPDLPQDLRSAIMLHSKSFDPKNYLATVHPSATFKDLSYGREHLKEVLEQRSEALKVLVEAEFDRFVGVKAATEDVYQEMKQGPLQNGSDFGVKDLKQTLKGKQPRAFKLCAMCANINITEASTKADSVYTPILDAAMKATRLRSTLTVFERNKFFFNLPGQLLDAIEHVGIA